MPARKAPILARPSGTSSVSFSSQYPRYNPDISLKLYFARMTKKATNTHKVYSILQINNGIFNYTNPFDYMDNYISCIIIHDHFFSTSLFHYVKFYLSVIVNSSLTEFPPL